MMVLVTSQQWATIATILGPLVVLIVGIATQIRQHRASKETNKSERVGHVFEAWGDITTRLEGEITRLSSEIQHLRKERDDLRDQVRELSTEVKILRQWIDKHQDHKEP